MNPLSGATPDRSSERGEPSRLRTIRPSTLLAVAVLVGYLILQSLYALGIPLVVFDEPIELVNALNVLDGQWPHIGFVTTYPPLHYYALAVALRGLGVSIVAARLVQIGFLCVVAASLLAYMRRASIPWRMAVLATVCALAAGQIAEYPHYPPLALSFLGLMCYLLAFGDARSRRRMLLLSGALTGLSFVGRINFGAYVAGAIWLTYLTDVISDWRGGDRQQLRSRLAEGALFTGAFTAAILLYLLPYGRHVTEVIDQIVRVPPKLMAGVMFASPVGSIRSPRSMLTARTFLLLAFTVFPLVWAALRVKGAGKASSTRARRLLVGAAIVVVGLELVLGQVAPVVMWTGIIPITVVLVVVQLTTPLESGEFAILVAFTFYLHYYLNRPDFPHLFFQGAIAALLLPMVRLEPGGWAASRRHALGSIIALGVVTVPVAAWHLYAMAASGAVQNGARVLRWAPVLLGRGDGPAILSGMVPVEVARVIVADTDEVRAARYVDAHTKPADAVYVGLSDHSRAFINDIRLYWLLGRPVGSRHILLMTGLITTPEAQAEVREDLLRRRVDWVVLWDGYPERQIQRIVPPRGSALLDDYIRSVYEPRARFGAFTVMQRSGGGPSPAAGPAQPAGTAAGATPTSSR